MKESVLLLHGALGSSGQFDKLKDKLSPDFNVFAPDLPGHGLRAGVSFTIKDLADFIGEYIELNIPGKTHIFGYSMGGYAGLLLGSSFPQKISSVITLGTRFEWSPDISKNEAAMLDADKIIEKIPKFAALLEIRHGAEIWRKVLEETVLMMQDLGNQQYLNKIDLSEVRFPVMITSGSLDSMVDPGQTEMAAARFPYGQFLIHENMKHPFETVDTIYIAKCIVDFVSQLREI
jgi:pimeloyl-ACP methyl ester carboxylesterase